MKTIDTPIVPANYFSWREIGESEKLNLDRLQDTVISTYKTLLALSQAMEFSSLKSFSSYYNRFSNNLTSDKKYNHFFYHGKLAPFAHLFRLFVGDRLTKNGTIQPLCDFGILKSYYIRYRKTGELPKLENRGSLKKNLTDPTKNRRTKVKFDDGGVLDIPQDATYKRFVDGIQLANSTSIHKVTIPQMVLTALDMFMDARPDVFDVKTASIVPDSLIAKKSNSLISADISPAVTQQMKEIIQRYNGDNTPPISQSQYIEMAIKAMNERIPIEYIDPNLAKELNR